MLIESQIHVMNIRQIKVAGKNFFFYTVHTGGPCIGGQGKGDTGGLHFRTLEVYCYKIHGNGQLFICVVVYVHGKVFNVTEIIGTKGRIATVKKNPRHTGGGIISFRLYQHRAFALGNIGRIRINGNLTQCISRGQFGSGNFGIAFKAKELHSGGCILIYNNNHLFFLFATCKKEDT